MKVNIFFNYANEKRKSMDNYGSFISQGLNKFSKKYKVKNYKPKLNFPLNKYFNLIWRLRISRYILYPIKVFFLSRCDLTYVVDHQYGHLVNFIDSKFKVITIHDLIPIILCSLVASPLADEYKSILIPVCSVSVALDFVPE